ncbi:MAG: nuclear transport factor 2 family protein, partial [Candidatus Thiodiazotropha taylori]
GSIMWLPLIKIHSGLPIAMNDTLQNNKDNAISFYRMAYLGNPTEAVERYVGDQYIQHNPLVGDGKQAFIDYFTEMAKSYPEKSIEFVRAVAEGDLVALHTHQSWPGDEEYVTMDFFRFDDAGKIVEHWDSIQSIPQQSKNGNSMY